MDERQEIYAYTYLRTMWSMLRCAVAMLTMTLATALVGPSWLFWAGALTAFLFASLWCRIEAGTFGYRRKG